MGKEDGSPFGLSVKSALEGHLPPVYGFLAELGLDPAKIVKMGEAETNGHRIFKIWIGTPINGGELNEEAILRVGGTGCLEIMVDQELTKTFIKLGRVVLKTITSESRKIDPRQGKMDI